MGFNPMMPSFQRRSGNRRIVLYWDDQCGGGWYGELQKFDERAGAWDIAKHTQQIWECDLDGYDKDEGEAALAALRVAWLEDAP